MSEDEESDEDYDVTAAIMFERVNRDSDASDRDGGGGGGGDGSSGGISGRSSSDDNNGGGLRGAVVSTIGGGVESVCTAAGEKDVEVRRGCHLLSHSHLS